MNDDTHLAIIGMACRFPGANDPETFWTNLDAGIDSVRAFTAAELDPWWGGRSRPADPSYVTMHGVVDGIGEFDAGLFGYTARDAAMLNPEQQMFLECSWEALERAGYDPLNVPGVTGVYGGAARNGYGAVVRERTDRFGGIDDFAILLANDPEHLCARVAYKLGLTGPAVTVLTACSTSLVAVHEAGRSLLAGDCDVALAGGVSLRVPRAGYWYQENGVMSQDGHCRAFDASADGIVAGDGAGVVVLRRLQDAVADGDPVLAVIRGTAVNNDGRRRTGFTAPSVQGQAEVIQIAHETAGIEADSIGYVEAHGTGTPVGDPIEVRALSQAFKGVRCGSVALGSVKTNLGHTDTAAGAAGLIKTVLMLQHRRIPPSLGFHTANPEIDFGATPFEVNTVSRPWESPGRPRMAGVSSFGIGGVNAHVVVQEAPETPVPEQPATGCELLVLSARSPQALAASAEALAAHLREQPGAPISDVAWTLQTGRHEFPYRGHMVWKPGSPPRLQQAATPAGRPTVVFMFPGQGSQRPGMTGQLYAQVPAFRAALDECCELAKPVLGRDLRELLYPPPDRLEEARAELGRIEYGQPALFVVDYALARFWLDLGVIPEAMIGHSLGELVAACLAGVLSLADAVALVARRAAVLAQMPPGDMLAVSLAEAELRDLIDARDDLAIAAVNGPHQCVVAGAPHRVVELAAQLDEIGAHSRRVAAEHAYHTPMMKPAAAAFRAVLDGVELSAPTIPFTSTISGDWITDAEATDPDFWAQQLSSPVLFEPAFQTLLAGTADNVLLEVGPGQTLSSLATLRPQGTRRRALPALGDVTKASDEVGALRNTVGQLWQAGVRIDWRALHGGRPPRRTALPPYPFERENHLVLPLRTAAAPQEPEPALTPGFSPKDSVERQLLGLFRTVLGCDEQLTDPHFFEQGGDSLAALQLMSLVERTFGAAPPLTALFEEPTVTGLAKLIEDLLNPPEGR
jgi:acyl transferase domain-containing protein